jgi:putative transposase
MPRAFPIRLMCRCLRVSPSGYYGWVTRPPGIRAQENAWLLARIHVLHADHDCVVGESVHLGRLALCGRAVWASPGGPSDAPSRLVGRAAAAALAHPSGTLPAGIRNHLERDFTATAPNTKWVTDITYVRTAEHWLHLCVVLDLYPGVIVGWSMSARQDCQLVVQAVLIAIWQRPTRIAVILHSDGGCQFTSEGFQQFLAAHQMTCSMSALGSCVDSALLKVSSAASNGNGAIGEKSIYLGNQDVHFLTGLCILY